MLWLLPAPTSAEADGIRVFKEVFGSVSQPQFGRDRALAVDQETGDLLVFDAFLTFGPRAITRWNADGTPSEFSALGSNSIDGQLGPGGKPCAEEAASCDRKDRPQDGFIGGEARVLQVAVAPSGAAGGTAGNIYLTQPGVGFRGIDIFSSDGEYLGQLTGAGTNSFVEPCGVTVDSAGAVYVSDWSKSEIHKFVPNGNPPTNLDHVASFDTVFQPCNLAVGAGPSAGSLFVASISSPAEEWPFKEPLFKLDATTGAQIYVDPTTNEPEPIAEDIKKISVDPATGRVIAAGIAFVQEWDAAGPTRPEQPFVTIIDSIPTRIENNSIEAVATYGAADLLYVSRSEGTSGILTNVPTVDTYDSVVPTPTALSGKASEITETSAKLEGTVDPEGAGINECLFEYVLDADHAPDEPEPYAAGKTVPCEQSSTDIGEGTDPVLVSADITGLTPGTIYHFRLAARNLAGRSAGVDRTFVTHSLPAIVDEEVRAVTESEATVRVRINPKHFATSFKVIYGLSPAYGQSTAELPVGADDSVHLRSVTLRGLQSGSTYNFRVLASSEHGTTEGPNRTLTTYAPFIAQSDCVNQNLRSGKSTFLPDCRAYEMVSPVDKKGGDIVNYHCFGGDPCAYVQVAPDGDRLAYGVGGPYSFADAQNNFFMNEYIAARRPGEGWASDGIYPPISGGPIEGGIVFGINRNFSGFTPDLCSAWFVDFQTPPPVPEASLGFANLLRRDNCEPGAGSLEALTDVEPPEGTSTTYIDSYSFQGSTPDGAHALFVASAPLTPDASLAKTIGGFPIGQVYDRVGGHLELVSVLPDGAAGDPEPGDAKGFAAPTSSTAGSGWQTGNLAGALATDGSSVYWTSGNKIYLRRHFGRGIVAGECLTQADPCTVSVSAGGAFFWAGSDDGSRALYSEGDLQVAGATLHEFNTGQPAPRLIAAGVRGVVGTSDDLTRIYFVSDNKLTDEAQAGQPNLYLDDGGELSFVGALVQPDLGAKEPGVPSSPPYHLVERLAILRAARVTPDGARIVFQSRAPLTDYDNTDPETGKPTVEVYTYEAGGELHCVSCNPSGARPRSAELRMPYWPFFGDPTGTKVLAAAWIPTWEHPLYASNVVSEDGSRIFFNSHDELLPRDANGAQDVYEWEAAGSGSCDIGDGDFFAGNGGCLYLISTGAHSRESEFWEASPDGDDVFFTTAERLALQDPGSIDLYDARVEGGFPVPAVSAECEGEACQSPPPPPRFDAPGSTTYRGPGNESPKTDCRPAARRAAKLAAQARRKRTEAKHAEAKQLARRAGKLKRNVRRCRSANRRAGR